ncbi:hypothetical protein DPMN_193464 [Dreissena polymorpha]|uniref:Uncharacterized protein n=1 Tax=Dreissena polymorpha TaxID=45954 RepID=A0A9D3Y1V6_DREPO|nr:hypothetical protein DPMN_193464 [Dreissena polymorpha]
MILIPRVILPQSQTNNYKNSTGRCRPIYQKPIIRGRQLYKTSFTDTKLHKLYRLPTPSLQELHRSISPSLQDLHQPLTPTLQEQHCSLTPSYTNFIVH